MTETKLLPATPKTLLVIQFRDDITLEHEQTVHRRFIATQGTNLAVQFVSYFDNAVALASPKQLLQNVSGVILGGSAGLSIAAHATSKSRAVVRSIRALLDPIIDTCIAQEVSILGTCFGHQLLALHFGGQVVFDTKQAETGIVDISLLPNAHSDALFARLPSTFKAIVGHQDTVVATPESAAILARSTACNVQAVRYAPNIWGTQFHPDLAYEDLMERLRFFPQYLEYAATIEVAETSSAALVLSRFLQVIGAK